MNHVDLDTLVLQSGPHRSREEGVCLLEAVAWYAELSHSDMPECVSPVLRAFCTTLNDRLDDRTRQRLKVYIPRLIGTVGDEAADTRRAWMAADWAVRTAAPRWLRAAGLSEKAEILEAFGELTAESTPALLPALRAIREDCWQIRVSWRERIRTAVRKALDEKFGADAAAVADAAADAAAAAAAAADADADAVADAAADAAAAADAVADAEFKVGSNLYWKVHNAVYEAVRDRVQTRIRERHGPLLDEHNESAFALLDRLIDVRVEVSK